MQRAPGQFVHRPTAHTVSVSRTALVRHSNARPDWKCKPDRRFLLFRPPGIVNGMKCPFCREDNDRVLDTRSSQDGFTIRRRRECLHCKRRYTTFERVEELDIKVIKKDGSRVPFEREKIKRGLEKACWKRPISSEQIDAVVSAVEADVYSKFDTEVEADYIGELVMNQLRLLDQVAYVRFASVYREFQDAHDFVDELEPMLRPKERH